MVDELSGPATPLKSFLGDIQKVRESWPYFRIPIIRHVSLSDDKFDTWGPYEKTHELCSIRAASRAPNCEVIKVVADILQSPCS